MNFQAFFKSRSVTSSDGRDLDIMMFASYGTDSQPPARATSIVNSSLPLVSTSYGTLSSLQCHKEEEENLRDRPELSFWSKSVQMSSVLTQMPPMTHTPPIFPKRNGLVPLHLQPCLQPTQEPEPENIGQDTRISSLVFPLKNS